MDAAVLADVLSQTRQFIRERVVPREAEIDEKDEVPDDLRQVARPPAGYVRARPEECVGLPLPVPDQVRVLFGLRAALPHPRSLLAIRNGSRVAC